MTLSVIVPTYNEAENIGPLIARIAKALAEVDYDVTFIDDSTDGTADVLAGLAQRTPRLRVVHRQNRRGLASAVTEGIAIARGDVVCVLDADLQHPPEILPALLAALEQTGADLAIGSRYVPGGSYDTLSPARRMISRGAIALAGVFVTRARMVADPVSGFFAFRRRVVEGVHLRPIGYKILLEVLARGNVTCIVEVPYRFETREAGESKLTLLQNWLFLKHLFGLATAHPADAEPIRLSMIALAAVLVNTADFWLLGTATSFWALAAAVAMAATVLFSVLMGRFLHRRHGQWKVDGLWRLIAPGVIIQLAAFYLFSLLGVPALPAYLIAGVLGWGAGAWAAIRWVRRALVLPMKRIVYAAG